MLENGLGMPLFILLSYLLGSIPAAVWISKSFFGTDVRSKGSGNAGSTNMYRSFGFWAGFGTQLIDVLKGWLSPATAWYFLNGHYDDFTLLLILLCCGLAAVMGHTFPIFSGFMGGKGVNTMLGMMLFLQIYASLFSLGVFAVVLLSGRMVSLASMSAVYAFPVFLVARFWLNQQSGIEAKAFWVFLGIGLLLSIYVTWSHRANIHRIRSGTESRIALVRKAK